VTSAARHLPTLNARGAALADPRVQRSELHRLAIAREFDEALSEPLRADGVTTLQVNVGKVCNQTCRHCHVDAGPDREEVMSRETLELCLDVLRRCEIPIVDITGGAPELNPHFRWFVGEVKALGRHVMDRCNLTVLETPSGRDLPEFFAAHRIEVVCSLPHYQALGTDRQRGRGVYDKSIRALKRLNEVGYGDGRSGLELVLVTNPVGAFLPASQPSLEIEWKRELARLHGVRFDRLYTVTNMPISRFLEWLIESGNLASYMEKLVTSFNPAAATGVMCRTMLSVGWDGTLYDCDFNQMLELPVRGPARHVRDLSIDALGARRIETDRHCYGCTAGAGSSCGGSIA
jgi:radical SAM/Cys-rich protein